MFTNTIVHILYSKFLKMTSERAMSVPHVVSLSVMGVATTWKVAGPSYEAQRADSGSEDLGRGS